MYCSLLLSQVECKAFGEFRTKKKCDLTFYVTRLLRPLPLEYIGGKHGWKQRSLVGSYNDVSYKKLWLGSA